MNRIAQQGFDRRTGGVANNLVSAVERSPLQREPFDHIYMEDVFGHAEYEALLAAMPERRFYHELRHLDAMRSDGSSTRLRMYLYPELLRQLPPAQRRVWEPVARALCSSQLENALKRKFRTALERRFERSVEKVRIYPVPILLRDQPGYRIGIHADSPNKAITVQFYLPKDQSQRHIGTIFHEAESGDGAERTTQMKFLPSSGYAFPVSLTESWHSAATTTAQDGERVTMMVTYYVTNDPSSWFKYRLRRLALRFGIHPAG
jgi:hypothetical protein